MLLCLFAAKIAEKLNYISCTLIRIYQKGLNMANSTTSRASDSIRSNIAVKLHWLYSHMDLSKTVKYG